MTRVATAPECPASWHGTGWAYAKYGCRCPEAREDRRCKWHVNHSRSGRRRGEHACHRDVDHVVLERALRGEVVAEAGVTEREEIVRLLTARGGSMMTIARVLAVTPRAVGRIRHRLRARRENHT